MAMSSLRLMLRILLCILLLLVCAEKDDAARLRKGSCMARWLTLANIKKSSIRIYEESLQALNLDETNHHHPPRRTIIPFLFHRHPKDAKKFINCIEKQTAKCRRTPVCGVGGKCLLNAKKVYYCKCKVGMTGEFCDKELDGCKSNPCQHGAKCTNTLGRYQCTCQPGFEGRRCEKRWLSRGVFKALPQQVAGLTSAMKSLNSSLNTAINSLSTSVNSLTTNVKHLATKGKKTNKNMNKKIEGIAKVVKMQAADLALLKKTVQTKMSGSCAAYYKNGFTQNGKYVLRSPHMETKRVWCDMKTDGGGWTVIQRRKDGSVDFFRKWNDYKNGFGDVSGEFWLGNDWIHRLTSGGQHELRIDFSGGKYAKYSQFTVAGEGDQYRLTVSGFSGNVRDKLSAHNNQRFTTKDRDNDIWYSNCANRWFGAWWYYNCLVSNLNGIYGRNDLRGLQWSPFFATFVEMKIR